jgi:hypothetical protein
MSGDARAVEKQDYAKNIRRIENYIKNTDESILLICLYRTLNDLEWLPEYFPNVKYLDANEKTPNFIRDWFNIPAPPREIVAVRYTGTGQETLKSISGYAEFQRELLNERPHVMIFCLPDVYFPDFARMAANFLDWHSGNLFDFSNYSNIVLEKNNFDYEKLLDQRYVESKKNINKNEILETIDMYIGDIENEIELNNPDLSYIARKYNLISRNYYSIDCGQKALEYQEKSTIIFRLLAKEKPNLYNIILADGLYDLSIYNDNQGNKTAALDFAKEAVEIYENIPNYLNSSEIQKKIAQSWEKMSEYYNNSKNIKKALESMDKCVKIYEKLYNEDTIEYSLEFSISLMNLGIINYSMGWLEKAIDSGEKSIIIARKMYEKKSLTATEILANSFRFLSLVEFESGNFRYAADLISEAVEIYKNVKIEAYGAFLPKIAANIYYLSEIKNEISDANGAIDTIKEAIAIYEKLNGEQPGKFSQELEKSLELLEQYQKNTPSQPLEE